MSEIKRNVINSTNSFLKALAKANREEKSRITLVTSNSYVVCNPVRVKVEKLNNMEEVSKAIHRVTEQKGGVEAVDIVPSMVHNLLEASGGVAKQEAEVIYASDVKIHPIANPEEYIESPSISIFTDSVVAVLPGEVIKGRVIS